MTTRLYFVGALIFAAVPIHAADLWNQISGLPVAITSFPDQEFDDGIFDSFTTYLANDVEVSSGGWSVDSITIEIVASQPSQIVNVNTGRLNVFANPTSAITPAVSDDPMTGQLVPVAISAVSGSSNRFFLTASGLNLSLASGEYWIDLTPVAGIAVAAESLEIYSQNNGAGAILGTAAINPGGGYMFKSGANWDTLQAENSNLTPQYGAIDIQGAAVPEPTTMILVAVGLAGLALRRRQ